MRSRLQNQLNMVGACLTVAQSAEYQPAWDGQDPEDFGTGLAQLQSGYGDLTARAAQAEAATGGAADAKALAESALEDTAFVLARALAVHFKKTGDLTRRGKVDLSHRDLVKLRAQDLLTQATAIRDLATVAAAEPDAAKRGVTAARVATLSAALTAYARVMNLPRGEIVNRGTILREVETDAATLLDGLHDLDDLVVQFDGTEAGRSFIAAWKRARIIVDAGGGHDGSGAEGDGTSRIVSRRIVGRGRVVPPDAMEVDSDSLPPSPRRAGVVNLDEPPTV